MSNIIMTKENPINLKTPSLSSEYTMYKDIKTGKKSLYARSAAPFCIMTSGASMICTKCW